MRFISGPFLFRSIIGIAFSIAVINANAEAGTNPSSPLLEKFDKGYINWKSGEYIANVSAPAPAEYRGKTVNEAMAKELALRVSRALADSVFLQIVADTRVDAKQRLSQLLKNDTEIKLAGNVRGKELIKQKWVTRENKLWLEASYRISMRGVNGVIANIYDKAIETRPAESQKQEPEAQPKPEGKSKTTTGSEKVVYIDARGTGLQPALFPRIMDQSHARLFTPLVRDKADIVENGFVEYVVADDEQTLFNLDVPSNSLVPVIVPAGSLLISAMHPTILDWVISPAAGEDAAPIRKRKKRKALKASEAQGLLKSNIIVSKEDADKLRLSMKNGEISGSPRIIVITDGTVGGTEGKLDLPYSHWAFLMKE